MHCTALHNPGLGRSAHRDRCRDADQFFAPGLPVYGAPAPVAPVLFDFLEPFVPIAQVVQVPQVQLTEKIVESPEIQSAQDTQTSVSLGLAPSRRV